MTPPKQHESGAEEELDEFAKLRPGEACHYEYRAGFNEGVQEGKRQWKEKFEHTVEKYCASVDNYERVVNKLYVLTEEKEALLARAERLTKALEKIADPRKRHKEPDSYTELGCVMNIANEALAKEMEGEG